MPLSRGDDAGGRQAVIGKRMRRLLNIGELSAVVGATRGTLYQWRSQGRLDEYIVRVGRSLRFDLMKVEMALEQGRFAQPRDAREEKR